MCVYFKSFSLFRSLFYRFYYDVKIYNIKFLIFNYILNIQFSAISYVHGMLLIFISVIAVSKYNLFITSNRTFLLIKQ